MPQDPATLRQAKLDVTATLLACGVDPKQSILFEQSRVRSHAELAWIFNCITPVGWLGRMTQWKSKLEKVNGSHAHSLSEETLNTGLKMGLFDYPVLQAADILLYKATHVPVGEDQIQHLELTRDITDIFNKRFGNVFPKPNAILPPSAKRIMSLRDPTQKMSKSDPADYSRLNLVDLPELIRSKIAKATTDNIRGVSYDPVERPGVSNLLSIYAAMRDIEVEEAVKECADITSTKAFKDRVSDAIIERLSPIQSELVRLQADKGYINKILDEGAVKANEIANNTMEEVFKAVGLK
ncbi:tryptophanyl-tRNA synthetase [Cokeromyces recurvatus]|uniref:tryptophanyl-tRNA synthetase n=1 Tax=Cokeromyces recurvatus TaxID=90255 RepID=UPI00221F048B|nr:tryptophanyl-tRNA synthetase [Cokeromyces recurvatus]KAI7899889.1 tryptophanyl-tRNA synthetase [Cokeromyces recurvatus]